MHLSKVYPLSAPRSRCIGALAVLSVMCSCSDEQSADVSLTPLRIDACVSAPSRSTVPLDGSVYSLWATMIFTSDTQSGNYFGTSSTPRRLSYNAATATFGADDYYYPLNGSLSVAAVGVNSANASTVPASILVSDSPTSYIKRLTQVSVDLSTTDGTKEVIYSDVSTIDCSNAANRHVTLHLHRPYAALTFNFIPVDPSSCRQIVIDKIEIPNVSWQGIYQINYNDDGTAQEPLWTSGPNVAGTKTIEFATSQRMVWDDSNDKPLPLTHNLYLVSEADRQQIIIYYTVNNGSALNGNVKDNDDNVRHLRYIIPAQPTEKWLLKYQYTYNITVHGNSQMDYNCVDVIKVESGITGDMHI